MKQLIQTLTSLLLIFAFSSSAEDAPQAPSMTEAQAIEHLTKVENFGFGPAKGQVERASDSAFKALLSNPNSKEKFTTLFEKGGTSAKLYALCALHSLDPSTFEKLSKSMKMDELIFTQFGCVVEELKVSEIIKNISNGDYDAYCKVTK